MCSNPEQRRVDAILNYARLARAEVIPHMLAIGMFRNSDQANYLHVHIRISICHFPELTFFLFLFVFANPDTPAPKMIGKLGKKAKTPTKRGGKSDLQALQKQFAA